MSAMVRYVRDAGVDYDDCCFCLLRSEHGLVGRVVQDVVTRPVKKEALIIGTGGTLRWINGFSPRGDAIVLARADQPEELIEVPKTRPDDFIWELQHIDDGLAPDAPATPLDLQRGVDTMLVLAAAHQSQQLGRRVRIDYSRGPNLEALV